MKRLLKKIALKKTQYEQNEKVRFINKSKTGIYTVMAVDKKKNTYTLLSPNGSVEFNIGFDDLVGENEFVPGDMVIYRTHPYDNIKPYEVKEMLQDGTYFIENKENAYTGINGKNLMLLPN